MRSGTTWPLLTAMLMGMGLPAAAQTGGAVPEAETVARRLFADLDSMRWSAAAARFHPVAVERFRAAQLRELHLSERVEGNPRRFYGPDMPPAVAEWMQRRDSMVRAQTGPEYVRSFAGVHSLSQLDSLPAPDLLARWLEAHDERVRLRAEVARLRPELAGRVPDDSLVRRVNTVVGSVLENDTTAHVLVRTATGGGGDAPSAFGELSVLTLRRAGDGWRAWHADNQAPWLGMGFGFEIESTGTADERARVLDAVKDSTLAWRDPATQSRVRAAIVGYPGRGKPPRGLLVEVRAADGSLRSAEIPFGAFQELMNYLMPWAAVAAEEAENAGR